MIKHRSSYLILSSFSGLIELGIVILVLFKNYSILIIPVIALAYQLGALFREPIKVPSIYYFVGLILSLFASFFASKSIILFFIFVFFLSMGIQGLRGLISEHIAFSTAEKRISRLAGFLLSGVLSEKLLPIISGFVLILSIFIFNDLGWSQKRKPQWLCKYNPLGLTMMVHQSHYFVYAYMIPFIFVKYYSIRPICVGLLFSIGWLSYILSKNILGGKRLFLIFVGGHIYVAIILLIMYLYASSSLILLLILWCLTGIGGGTVYSIRKIQDMSSNERGYLDAWENVGHILGLIICILFIYIYSNPSLVFLVAAILAISTCILFVLTQKRMIGNKI